MTRAFAELARARRSIRGFLPDPVPQETLIAALQTARTAPSGANLQPGFLDILTDKRLADFTTRLSAAIENGAQEHCEYSYFPDPMPADLKARQRAAGFALYQALGIARRDLEGRRAQFMRNYRFFDAPVGIIVSLPRALGAGCYMDLGMFMQNLMLAVTDLGLASCGIGAMANFGREIRKILHLPEDRVIVAGLAIGYADPAHPANRTITEREDVANFARFHGFGEPRD